MFSTSIIPSNPEYSTSAGVLDVLTAVLLLHYPYLKKLSTSAPGPKTIESCAAELNIYQGDLLEWSTTSERKKIVQVEKKERIKSKTNDDCNVDTALQRQMTLIEQLIEENSTLTQQLQAKAITPLEHIVIQETEIEMKNDVRPNSKRARKTAVTNMSDAWYEWYATSPRLWISGDPKRRSTLKQAVSFMKLFLPDGLL